MIVMALMIVLLADDLRATRRGDGAPAWYLGVRVPLTVLIEVAAPRRARGGDEGVTDYDGCPAWAHVA